ncbi:hypothetical protein ASD13_05645 [Microbacterium sp. Root1433D1]|uniref:Lrp/AsnC family transcriptional regulator n=1 Tax=Microbacterium sp. Root1433D1 TaxID=1736463 RepID=UPI0006F2B873|nr:Lrp/AsnC family transcriptional regulator [Microbacterium sp. Root1433D1]KQY78136.1 hypothetical protein ASD13_05645 [Microbacterium sp. Root1433D1]
MTESTAGDSREEPASLDEQDLAIIASLQEDGRRSYGSLADAVGLSETAVRRRTQRLVEASIIRIVAVPDAAYLRKTVGATIGVFCDASPEPIIEALDAMPEIDYIVSTLGRYNLMVEAQGSSNEHLLELTHRILELEGVSGIESNYYVRYHKQTYSWPPSMASRLDRKAES